MESDKDGPTPPSPAERAPLARSRRALVGPILAAVALTAGVFFWVVRTNPAVFGVASLDDLTEVERAHVLRESALRECGSKHWKTCLDELDHAKGLDPKGDVSPAVQEQRGQAYLALRPMSPPEVATLRQKAFQACDTQRWADCLDALDEARQQDPQGDLTPDVDVARSKAAHGLRNAPSKDAVPRPAPGDPR